MRTPAATRRDHAGQRLCPANAACQIQRARSIAGRSERTNWRSQPGKVLALVST
jgi:hypothetical protein